MELFLSDYLRYAVNGDASPAIRAALADARPGTTLHLGGGRMDFYPDHAADDTLYISNNDGGEKRVAIPLTGLEDFTLDGDGADLNFHGRVLPLTARRCRGLRLTNFSVDYPYPFFFQAEITRVTDDFIELTYDRAHFDAAVDDGAFRFSSPDGWSLRIECPLVTEFDAQTRAPSAFLPPYFAHVAGPECTDFLAFMHHYLKAEQVGDNVIRLTGTFPGRHTVGSYWVCTFGGRANPGIVLDECADVLVENVTLHSTSAMGIQGQLCENVTLRGVRAIPREGSGRLLSINADATHFVNCTGTVRMEDCVFLNMLDDAGNIHGIYMKVLARPDERTYFLGYGHRQQRGMNIFRPGDTAALVNNRTLETLFTFRVENSTAVNTDLVRVTADRDLPLPEEGFCLVNETRQPEIVIKNCVCGNNRPRGFLLSSARHTEVSGCTFFDMNAALYLSGDCNSWFESGQNEDTVIENNDFRNAAYAGGPVIAAEPVIRQGDIPYHKNLTVRNNRFTLADRRFLYARYTQGIRFTGNTFVLDDTLPSHGDLSESGILLEGPCPDAVVEDVKE